MPKTLRRRLRIWASDAQAGLFQPVQTRRKSGSKRGKDMDRLKNLMTLLLEDEPLSETYLDHPLRGRWRSFRDVHIEPDWLLIYGVT
jgi:YafQ family addiction module toxin component